MLGNDWKLQILADAYTVIFGTNENNKVMSLN